MRVGIVGWPQKCPRALEGWISPAIRPVAPGRAGFEAFSCRFRTSCKKGDLPWLAKPWLESPLEQGRAGLACQSGITTQQCPVVILWGSWDGVGGGLRASGRASAGTGSQSHSHLVCPLRFLKQATAQGVPRTPTTCGPPGLPRQPAFCVCISQSYVIS